jgi:hypothetical protein
VQNSEEVMNFIITMNIALVLIVYSVDSVRDILSKYHTITELSHTETEMYEFHLQDLKYLNNMLVLK